MILQANGLLGDIKMKQKEKKLIAQKECKRLRSLGVKEEICQELYRRLMKSTEFRFNYSLRELEKVERNMGDGFKIMRTKTANGTGIDEVTVYNNKTIFWIEFEKKEEASKEEIDLMDIDISPVFQNFFG